MSDASNLWSNFYHYDPNIPVAGVAAGVYTIASIALTWQTRKYKTKYMWNVCAASYLETIGYYMRIYSGMHTDDMATYIPSAFFLLLPPLILAVGSYRTLAHIMKQSGAYKRQKVVKWVENVFLYLDIAAFMTQASGGSLMAQPKVADVGIWIALAGMAISCANFVAFAVAICYMHVNVSRQSGQFYNTGIQKLFVVLYVNIICLNIRSVYRLVEFAGGILGYVNTHEVFFLVFDTLLILTCVGMWVAFPPGKYLQFHMQDDEKVAGGSEQSLQGAP